MPRRLHSARSVDPDPTTIEGFDPPLLEGDPLVPTADAGTALRVFARDVPESGLGLGTDPAASPGERVLRQARELARQGRRLEAELLLRQHLAVEPADRPSRVLLATVLAGADEADAAIDELSAVLAGSLDPEVLVQRGALYAQTGQAALAERDFKVARSIDPTHCAASRYLGVTLLRRGLAGEALAVLGQAAGLAPDDAEMKLALGEALAGVGRMEEALVALEDASRLDPRDPRPLTLAGRLLDRLGRSEDALTMHRRARDVARP